MKCIIIEDQLPAQRILKKYIEDINSLKLIDTFTDPLQAMKMLNSESVDIIFLDIHLPKISGIEFLKSIINPPQVILTTAFPNYALESYDLNVTDYLLKPFSFERFVKAVMKVSSKINPVTKTSVTKENTSNKFFLKSGSKHIKIDINDIDYINSDFDYTDIYLSHVKYTSSQSLKYWQDRLSDQKFIRVHKSYIINQEKIKKIVGNKIYLSQKIIIPIGRTYKKKFTEQFIK